MISMQVDFTKRLFTMQTKAGKCDFVFLDTHPEAAKIVLRLMQEATNLAIEVLAKHAKDQVVQNGLD